MTPPDDILDALRRMWLLDGAAEGEPLAGGVSSDIWRIDLASGPVREAEPALHAGLPHAAGDDGDTGAPPTSTSHGVADEHDRRSTPTELHSAVAGRPGRWE